MKYENLVNQIQEIIENHGFKVDYEYQELDHNISALITSQPGFIFFFDDSVINEDIIKIGVQYNALINPMFFAVVIELSKHFILIDCGVIVSKNTDIPGQITFITDKDEIIEVQKQNILDLAKSIMGEVSNGDSV